MKFTAGAIVGQLSGKQGSTVASHNRNGPYFRNRAIPVNPRSNFQQGARNNFAAASAAWRSLSPALRTAWNTAANGVELYDRLGRPYSPSGQQYFVSASRLIFVYNPAAALPSSPPSLPPPSALLTAAVTAVSA